MSMARVAEVTAAVPWLATLFELAATSIRLVTAMSPKTSTTTATRASTSVKPASPPRPLRSRLAVVHVSVPHGWGSTRPPGAMRTVRSREVAVSRRRISMTALVLSTPM